MTVNTEKSEIAINNRKCRALIAQIGSDFKEIDKNREQPFKEVI